ncbi:ANTAR domain-containing protein [Microbacterium sp. P02]|uniref:ANTAR domain-containing protein n=1 Tax=Microbacterium sp. P02 TaxID=3366260 RepID=UPI00366DE2B1
MTRERELVRTFVELADTLVAGYDIVDLLYRLVTRCARTLNAADAGILLARADGTLEVVASTSERSMLIGLLQLDESQGPCVGAYRTGHIVTVDNIADMRSRWPAFVEAAGAQGYQTMHAIPLRLREQTIGSLNLFGDTPGPLSAEDALVAQGLADIATIGILHERALRESNSAREQLQFALDSRVIIEQAKGVLAQTERITPEQAFEILRRIARTSRRKLSDVAREVIDEAGRG